MGLSQQIKKICMVLLCETIEVVIKTTYFYHPYFPQKLVGNNSVEVSAAIQQHFGTLDRAQ